MADEAGTGAAAGEGGGKRDAAPAGAGGAGAGGAAEAAAAPEVRGVDVGESAVASMASLEARLEALEAIVGSSGGTEAIDAGSMAERLAAAHADLEQLSKDHKSIQRLRKKYKQVADLLDLEPDSVAGSTRAKYAVVGGMEDDIVATVGQLKEVKELEAAVNPDSLRVAPAEAERLDRVSRATAQQAAAARAMRESVNKMLKSYDTIMQAVSAKFVQWDATLSSMEAQVDKVRKQRSEDAPESA